MKQLANGWYRVEDRLIAVVGPLALQVVRVGSLWEGRVTTIGGDDGLVLSRSGKYRHHEKAQHAVQELAKEVLSTASAALASLKSTSTATRVPRA